MSVRMSNKVLNSANYHGHCQHANFSAWKSNMYSPIDLTFYPMFHLRVRTVSLLRRDIFWRKHCHVNFIPFVFVLGRLFHFKINLGLWKVHKGGEQNISFDVLQDQICLRFRNRTEF